MLRAAVPDAKVVLRLHLASVPYRPAWRSGVPLIHPRMDTRDRLLTCLLGCHAFDLARLLALWERYRLDLDFDDYALSFGQSSIRRAEFRFVMGVTLEEIGLSFLRAHGLPEDERRVEVNNFADSEVSFCDPAVQELFKAWRPEA